MWSLVVKSEMPQWYEALLLPYSARDQPQALPKYCTKITRAEDKVEAYSSGMEDNRKGVLRIEAYAGGAGGAWRTLGMSPMLL